MDARQFDHLAQVVASGTRRGLLRFLAALPLAGMLATLLDEERDAAARRKKGHKHKKGHNKHKPKKPPVPCIPDPQSTTCQDTCGTVQNNCKQTVHCDPCPCASPCAPCQVCDGGQCVGCPGCCDSDGKCQPGTTNAACGSSGACVTCTSQEQCLEQQCLCVPACTGKDCGPDGCGGVCGNCSGPPCNQIHCDEAIGRCIVTPIPDCCTSSDQCQTTMPCTIDTCASGTCQHVSADAGSVCIRSGDRPGVCDGAGQCVECLSATDCDDGNPCTMDSCDTNAHTCIHTPAPHLSSCGGTNYCLDGHCQQCATAAAPCVHGEVERCCDWYTGQGTCGFLVSAQRAVCCRFQGMSCQTNSECCGQFCASAVPDGPKICIRG